MDGYYSSDVTLAADDSAHKMVLTALSAFFSNSSSNYYMD